MKRIIALVCAAVFMALSLTACGQKNIYVDRKGNTHKLVMKHGDPVQDEYGNMIEKYVNSDGEKVTAPLMFPDVTKSGENELQNAYIKLNIPNDWSFDESTYAFRIKHKDINNSGVCEIFVEAQDHATLDEEYRRNLAAQEALNDVSDDGKYVENIEESETEIFGLKTKVFKSTQRNNITFYYYVFYYVRATVGFSFVMHDGCLGDKFDPKAFIEENVSLKTIPTK